MNAAAFLDRDGVLNRRPEPQRYVCSVDELEVLPGAAEAVTLLRQGGFLPIVVSNQRGVALGLLDVATLAAIDAALRERGVQVHASFYCTHDLNDGCFCRKPLPGLLLDATLSWNIDLPRSVMIGDTEADTLTARSVDIHAIRVGSETGTADEVAPDVLAAARLAVEWAR